MNQDQKERLMALNKKAVDTVPVEATPAVQEATDAPNPPVEEVELKEQTPTPEVQPQIEEPVVQKSWDEDEEPVTKVETPKFDFSKLGSALELNEIKSEDEVVAKVTELKSKLKSLEDNALEGVPEDLKEVIKVAKVGDYKEYLASQMVDYTKFDPVIEFENDFLSRAQKNPKYFTDGKFDMTKAEEALDSIPEAIQESTGLQILDAKIKLQQQQKAAIQAAAQTKLEQAEKSLTSAAKSLNELLPFESYGIKFEAKHSSEIQQGISNSKLTKKHLGVTYEDLVRSGADMKVVAATIAKAEYTEKMLKFKSGASKAEAKKEILATTQNPQIRNTGSPVNPTDPQKVVETPVDKLKKHFKRGL